MTWKTNVLRATALMTVVGALVALHALTGPAAVAKDFSGERITIIVPFREGGGTDTYTRFLAPYLSKKLPGQPVILVRNIPGAGGIAGTNQFEDRARPDGLTIMGISASVNINFMLGDPRVKYKLNTYRPFLLSPFGAVIYGSTKLGVDPSDPKRMVEKLRAAPNLLYGGQSPTSADNRTLLALYILGIKPRVVWGMKGRGGSRLAFERGEFNVNYDSTSAYLKSVVPMVKSGVATPLFTQSLVDENGNLVRDPTFPDIPHLAEVYQAVNGRDIRSEGALFAAWNALNTAGGMANKALALPAATPDDIVNTYVKAARDLMNDPAFQEARKKQLGVYPQVFGESARRFLKQATTLEPEARKALAKWLKEEYNHDL